MKKKQYFFVFDTHYSINPWFLYSNGHSIEVFHWGKASEFLCNNAF